MSAYPAMGPGRGADRPSCLAMNPDNVGASARRRAALLEQFDALPANTRADLLELAETWAWGAIADSAQARVIFRAMFAAAGWEAEYRG